MQIAKAMHPLFKYCNNYKVTCESQMRITIYFLNCLVFKTMKVLPETNRFCPV